MIVVDGQHLLMIEPTGAPSAEPLIDHLTRKMAGALASARQPRGGYRGYHACTGRDCAANSDNTDHYVAARGGDLETNSLAVHYLAYHRADVPSAELTKVEWLYAIELEPTPYQLSGRWEDHDKPAAQPVAQPKLATAAQLDWDRAGEAARRIVQLCGEARFAAPDATDIHQASITKVCQQLDVVVFSAAIARAVAMQTQARAAGCGDSVIAALIVADGIDYSLDGHLYNLANPSNPLVAALTGIGDAIRSAGGR